MRYLLGSVDDDVCFDCFSINLSYDTRDFLIVVDAPLTINSLEAGVVPE